MEIGEIFKKLSDRMVSGVMLHEQQADLFDFLNLHGYKRMSEYNAKCEMKSYRKIHRYYINHYNKLIEEDVIENPNIIPMSWYKYARQDVDTNTKRTYVRENVEKLYKWEKETKELYENLYIEALDIGEAAAANKIMCLIHKVDKELKYVTRLHIDLVNVDYDFSYILGCQQQMHDWYKERMYDKH